MPISIACPACSAKIKAPDQAAGRMVKCPRCGLPIQIPSLMIRLPHESEKSGSTPSRHHISKSGEQGPLDWPEMINDGQPALPEQPKSRRTFLLESIFKADAGALPYDKIATSVALVGLLLLAVSPLFRWVNFGTGGIIGLMGGGKILLGITGVAIAFYLAALIKQKWLTPVVLGVQAWATVAAVWMGALIWKISSVYDRSELNFNPFAAMIAIQIGPGAGLYLGLIGAFGVAVALGFVAIRRLIRSGSLKQYYVTQGIAIALAILWTFSLEVSSTTESKNTPKPGVLSVEEKLAKASARVAQKNQNPREWYRAEWGGGVFGSRNLDINFGNRPHTLKVEVCIKTEPDVPIKELYGELSIFKDDQLLYQTQIAHKPDVSFVESCYINLRFPYDDSNPKHRTLRFSKDNELKLMFTVEKVVQADGKVKSFD